MIFSHVLNQLSYLGESPSLLMYAGGTSPTITHTHEGTFGPAGTNSNRKTYITPSRQFEVAHFRCGCSAGIAMWGSLVGWLDQPETLTKSCPKGVLFKAFESGVVVTVIRQGSGEACFSDDCSHLQAATAAEL